MFIIATAKPTIIGAPHFQESLSQTPRARSMSHPSGGFFWPARGTDSGPSCRAEGLATTTTSPVSLPPPSRRSRRPLRGCPCEQTRRAPINRECPPGWRIDAAMRPRTSGSKTRRCISRRLAPDAAASRRESIASQTIIGDGRPQLPTGTRLTANQEALRGAIIVKSSMAYRLSTCFYCAANPIDCPFTAFGDFAMADFGSKPFVGERGQRAVITHDLISKPTNSQSIKA